MAAGFFAPDGANAVEARPGAITPTIADGWMRDVSHAGAGDGTVITATLVNQIIANLREFVTGLGGPADGSDTMLVDAAIAGLLAKVTYDPTGVGGDAFSMDNMVDGTTGKVLSADNKSKLDFLTVTGTADIDEIAARVTSLDAAVVLRGEWDASSGSFPDGGGSPTGTTEPGDSYIVTVAGTVDSIAFAVGDRLIALTADASTTTYADQWLKADYTDNWDSPALTGTPTAPTPTAGDDSTKIATTAFVSTAISGTTVVPVATNLGLAVSAASGALTIAMKGADGNDPSSSNVVKIPFRNATETTGTPTSLEITAATSLVVPSGAGLGAPSSAAFRLWIVAFNDGGTLRLGVVNVTTYTANTAMNIMPLNAWTLASSTAIDAAADSAQVIYTGTAVSSKAFTVLGFIEWGASGLTAGTWDTTNLARVQLYGPGVPLPGDVVQQFIHSTAQFGTASTAFVDSNFSQAISLKSAANMVVFKAEGATQIGSASNIISGHAYRDTTDIQGAGDITNWPGSGGLRNYLGIKVFDRPNTESSVTYKMRMKVYTGETCYWPLTQGHMELMELMA